MLAESVTAEVPRGIQEDLLAAVGAKAIAIRTGATSRLIATVDMPPQVDRMADLRVMEPITEIVDIAEPDKRAERASGPIPT